MAKYLGVMICLMFVSCSGSDSENDSSFSSSCPTVAAVSAPHPLDPDPGTALPLHTNGKATTWNWQLKGTVNTSYDVDVYDLDLFDTPAGTIASLREQGKTVVCYFSAGSSENWREDFSEFESADLGSELDGWEGERWLDIRSANVYRVMKSRMDLAVEKGCQGLEPDNMDGFQNDECFQLSAEDQLKYNQAIALYARQLGLSVGLKNDPDQVEALVNYFDFSVTEQCFQYEECESYHPFLDLDRPVFNAEYDGSWHRDPARSDMCSNSKEQNIRTLILDLELDDSYRYSCDGSHIPAKI